MPRATRAQLIGAIREFAEAQEFSSVHALFVDTESRAAFADEGWLARHDVQFHWHNRGYRDFDHYLEGFTAEKRKKARRERRRVVEEGIGFETLLGPQLDGRAIDEIYDLQRDTFLRHGHEPYLTREFFRALPAIAGRKLHDQACPASARDGGGGDVLLEPRCAVRPLLGGAREPPQPAFRGLLPPGHRLLHRATASRCSNPGTQGEAQGEPRFRAGQHLVHALDRRLALSRGHW